MIAVLLCSLPVWFSAAPQSHPVELRVLVHERWFAGWDALQATARDFEAAHPGVEVRILNSAGAAGGGDKVKMSLAGGLPIDVTWIDVTEFAAYLRDGALLDLQPDFDHDPDWRPDAYFEAVLDALRGPDGHLYGLPSTFTPYVMYVNLDLLAREGVDPPPPDWTWGDLERICRRVTHDRDGDGRIDQYGISLTQWWQALAPWIWQSGGRFLNEHGDCALDEPAAVEAVTFLHRLIHEEHVASNEATFANQLSEGLFQAGRCAFHGPVGYWETYRFREIRDFHWDVLPLPRGHQAATSVAMRFYVVPRTSRHPHLAYAFVRALAGPRMQGALARIGNGVPGLKSAAYGPDFLKPDVPPDHEQVFLQVLDHARFMPLRVDWKEIEKEAGAALEQCLLLDRATPEEACRAAAARADATLRRERELARRPRTGAFPFLLAQGCGGLLLLFLLTRLFRRRGPPLARHEERVAWLFLTPWAIGFALLLVGPALVAALLSFTEWSPLQPLSSARWMGFRQYTRLLGDPDFHDSLRVTLHYAALAVPLQLCTALGLALLLQRRGPGMGLLRTLFYLPAILSPVILGALWRWLLDDDGGPLDQGLRALGLPGPAWLRDPDWVVPAFVLMSLWTVGAQMLVFLAGLQGVDPRLHEAARLDGAGPWARLRHITIPALGPVLLLNLVVGTIQAFQLFAQPWVMTQGGPGNESRFLVLHLYEQGFRFLRMGYASAMAWVLFGLVFVLTLVMLRSSRHWVHYAGDPR